MRGNKLTRSTACLSHETPSPTRRQD